VASDRVPIRRRRFQFKLATLLDAESALPFADERAAKVRYLTRTARLEGRIAGMLRTTMFTSQEAFQKHERWALQLLTERETLEAELGVKVEDEK
jgi:hypothetical protein